MSYQTVEAGRGVAWLEQGVKLVLKNPAVFLVNALIFAVIYVVLMFIPLLGQLAAALLSPVLTAGMIYAYREEDRGGKAEIPHLFQGFQQSGKIGPLLLLGLPGVVAAIVMFVVTLVVIGGALLGVGSSISANSAAGVLGSIGGSFLILALIGFLVGLVVAALIVFAIPRVMFDGIEPFAAMKESLSASLSNFAPLLVFGIIVFVIALVLSFVLMLIPVLGQMLLMLVLSAVCAAAVYLAYREIFGGSAAAIPPPAPPA
jgi:uncharacterized membrane protein